MGKYYSTLEIPAQGGLQHGGIRAHYPASMPVLDLRPGWGSRLKSKRKALRLNQTQVAKAVGATTSAVSQWEKEQVQSIKGTYLTALAQLFGVSPEWIMGGEDSRARAMSGSGRKSTAPAKPILVTDIPQHRLDLIRMYGRLPDELRRSIRMLIETLAALHSERYQEWEREEGRRAADRDNQVRKS